MKGKGRKKTDRSSGSEAGHFGLLRVVSSETEDRREWKALLNRMGDSDTV